MHNECLETASVSCSVWNEKKKGRALMEIFCIHEKDKVPALKKLGCRGNLDVCLRSQGLCRLVEGERMTGRIGSILGHRLKGTHLPSSSSVPFTRVILGGVREGVTGHQPPSASEALSLTPL